MRGAIRRRLAELRRPRAARARRCMLAIALATWSVQDPKLAATPPMRRCAICWAALAPITSDLLMQVVGLASLALVLPVAVWGWRMLTHRRFDRERLRLGVLARRDLAAVGLRCLPADACRELAAAEPGLAA